MVINQRYPNCCGFKPKKAEVSTPEDVLQIPWIKSFTEQSGFAGFSVYDEDYERSGRVEVSVEFDSGFSCIMAYIKGEPREDAKAMLEQLHRM